MARDRTASGRRGQGRLVRRRIRRLPERLAPPTGAGTGFYTAGLFHRSAAAGWPRHGCEPAARTPAAGGPSSQPRLRRGARSDARVLVVAHVYYPEVWFDIEDRLARIPEPYDLVISLVEGRTAVLESEIAERLPHAIVHRVPNVGRDLGPLVELARARAFDGYDAILKVHTKRSPHRHDGDAWRVALLDGLMPSPEGIRRIIELLRRDDSVGLVVPNGHVSGSETWGSNRPLVEALAARIPFAFDPDVLRYPAGSMYWARPWVLRRLADLARPRALRARGRSRRRLDRACARALRRRGRAGIRPRSCRGLTSRPGCTVCAGSRAGDRKCSPSTYHSSTRSRRTMPGGEPISRTGSNVERARPLYDGHPQPVEPGELGRYDLSDPEVMRRQAALAADYGVDGFVMHYYWFDGRPLLERPLRNLLHDSTIDFPFALCWANENWTRRWDGLDSEVLIAQSYSEGWADRFYDDILPALNDSRYLTVDGRPLLVLYRIGHIKNARAAIERWKERAKSDGLAGLHVLAVVHSWQFEGLPRGIEDVIDGLVRFPRSRASGSIPSGTLRRERPRASRAISTPTTLRSTAPISRRPVRVGYASIRGLCRVGTTRRDAAIPRTSSTAPTRSRFDGGLVGQPLPPPRAPGRTCSSSTPGTSGPKARISSRMRGSDARTSRRSEMRSELPSG